MPTNITFPLFTDEEILFVDKDAANQFFSSITVPDAAPGEAGVVLQSANVAAPADITYVSMLVVDENNNQMIAQVASKSNYDELKAIVTNILLNMKSSGQMIGD